MKIALISATKASLNPIEKAFQPYMNEVEIFHLLDSSLLPLLKKEQEITPKIIQRFAKLIELAIHADVDIVQLTCSAFNDVTSILQPLYDVKLFRSDEAMLDQALQYEKVGLVSTVYETPIVLGNYLRNKNPNIEIESVVDDGVIHLINEGKIEEHDQRVRKMIDELDGKVDVIVLSQYSIAHVKDQVSTSVPILNAPDATVQRCLSYLKESK